MMAPTRVFDAHVHFWDPTRLSYPWLGSVPALARPFLPEDYPPFAPWTAAVDATSRDTEAHEGEARDATTTQHAVLFVEANCLSTENETEITFIGRLAERDARIRGIVAFVDLLDEKRRRSVLARLRELPLVRGVRHNIQGRASGFATQPPFVAGVEEVGRAGFAFDLCCTAGQLTEVTRLVRECPETRFVLDHCGKPAIAAGAFDTWSDELAALASLPNVACNLSGLLTEAGPRASDDDLRRWGFHALQCFGVSRLIYGSDWPVCTLAGGLARWRAFVDDFTAAWTPEDRDVFFAGNAQRIYGVSFND